MPPEHPASDPAASRPAASRPAVSDPAVSAPAATVVFTDGSCRGNPGPGGWAWAIDGGASDSGGEPLTTNQRMEVTAVLRALQSLPGPLHVVSDSTYVVNCFKDRWWAGWQRRGWKNTQGKPVANQDLWRELIPLVVEAGRPVTFEWVKGHSGHRMNDLVDLLATRAADAQ